MPETSAARGVRMSRAQLRVAMLIAIPGILASLVALGGFLVRVLLNRLDLPLEATIPAFYLAVGDAYGEGFTAGFALSFFLTLLAIAVSAWYDRRR